MEKTEDSLHPSILDDARVIAICQKVLRLATVAILSAFALVIIMTTLSTGPLVQKVGKSLYFVILCSALVSLATWFLRTRLEKRVRKIDPQKGSG